MKKESLKKNNSRLVKFNLSFGLTILIISLIIANIPFYVRAASFKRDFSVVWGGPYNENIYAMESASDDIFYVAGEVSNVSLSYRRIFLEKLDVSDRSSLPSEWAYIDERTSYFGDMILDSSENIYIAGTINLFPNRDILLLKFNDQGVLEWNITWGTGSDEVYKAEFYEDVSGKCLAIDSMNNVYVAGIIDETTGVLIKFNNLGEYEWNRTWNLHPWEDMKIDSNDNIYICGDFIAERFNISKINPQGDIQWNTTVFHLDSSGRAQLLVNSNGLFFCSSYFEVFLAKFDHVTGNQIWNSSTPIATQSHLERIKFDSLGDIIFLCKVGPFSGGPTFGGKFNSLGVFQWNTNIQGSMIQGEPKDLFLDNEDNVYILMSHWTGICIFKYNTIGEYLYYYCWGEPPDDPFLPIPAAFYVDSSNQFFISGTTLLEGEDDYNNFFIIFSPTTTKPEIPFDLTSVLLITLSTIVVLFIRRRRKLS